MYIYNKKKFSFVSCSHTKYERNPISCAMLPHRFSSNHLVSTVYTVSVFSTSQWYYCCFSIITTTNTINHVRTIQTHGHTVSGVHHSHIHIQFLVHRNGYNSNTEQHIYGTNIHVQNTTNTHSFTTVVYSRRAHTVRLEIDKHFRMLNLSTLEFIIIEDEGTHYFTIILFE